MEPISLFELHEALNLMSAALEEVLGEPFTLEQVLGEPFSLGNPGFLLDIDPAGQHPYVPLGTEVPVKTLEDPPLYKRRLTLTGEYGGDPLRKNLTVVVWLYDTHMIECEFPTIHAVDVLVLGQYFYFLEMHCTHLLHLTDKQGCRVLNKRDDPYRHEIYFPTRN